MRWTPTRRWLLRTALMWGLGAAILRVAVVPAERCPPVDAAAVRGAIDGAVGWLTRGERADGTFLYGYRSRTHTVSTDYNDTRHAGVLYVLYRAGATRAGTPACATSRRTCSSTATGRR